MKIARIAIGSALLASALPAAAALDLSRPGALDRLRAHKPGHFDAVLEVARVGERLTCDPQDLDTLKSKFPVDSLDCGIIGTNNGVQQRRMKFAIDGAEYSLTVRVRDTQPRLIGR